MALDLGRLIRLRSTIQATLDATDVGGPATVLFEAHRIYREQVSDMLEGDLLTEFEEVCPAWTSPGSIVASNRMGYSQRGITVREGRLYLSALVGWLNGLIESLQVEMQARANADAYAAEKVKSERGLGFKSES